MQSAFVWRVGVTGGPSAVPVATSAPMSKTFEIPLLKTDCSPEPTIPKPAPAPAKHRDRGTLEARIVSESNDWAETFAPPCATVQATTKGKIAVLRINATPPTIFGSPRPEL